MALGRGGLLALVLLAATQATFATDEAHEESEKESKKDADVPTLGPPQPAPQFPAMPAWDRYDCFTGVDSVIQQGWSQDQKDWCCKNKEIGCESGDSEGHAQQPFECRDVMESLIWPDEKRIWCCENKELGCAVKNQPFDCDENFIIWEFAWSDQKKGWCCKHKEKGCKSNEKFLAPMKGSDSKDGTLPFDCENDSDMDYWSGDKKAWCCGYSEKGCEKFSTTATTTTQTTTSTTNLGCRMECEIDGVKDTCKNFIQQTSVNDFLGDSQACSSAHQLILARCPECEICSEHEAGCNVLEGPTTTTPPPTTTHEPTGCYKPCLLNGIVADCKSRVQWSAEHLYFWNQTACHKAYDQVMGECSVCGDCPSEETGCVEARPADKGKEDPYDCDAKRDESWSAGKKAWCCEHRQKGCPGSEKEESEKDEKDEKDADFQQKYGGVPRLASLNSLLMGGALPGLLIIGGAVLLMMAWRVYRARSSYVNIPGQSRRDTRDIDVPILE